jgi:sugar lactone lactonase YvrE
VTLAPSLEVVAPTRNAVGESPLWHADEGRRVLDRHSRARRSSRRRRERHAHALRRPEMVGCLALADDGGLIAATARGVARLTVDNDVARLERIDDVAYPRDGMRATTAAAIARAASGSARC